MGGALSEAKAAAHFSATGVGVCTIQLNVQVPRYHASRQTYNFKNNTSPVLSWFSVTRTVNESSARIRAAPGFHRQW